MEFAIAGSWIGAAGAGTGGGQTTEFTTYCLVVIAGLAGGVDWLAPW